MFICSECGIRSASTLFAYRNFYIQDSIQTKIHLIHVSLIINEIIEMAVLGLVGDEFGFTKLRSYCSKSGFYDVFKQDKCTTLAFKRMLVCLCFRRSMPGKHGKNA